MPGTVVLVRRTHRAAAIMQNRGPHRINPVDLRPGVVQTMNIRRICPGEGGRLRAIRLTALRDAPEAFGETVEEADKLSDDEYEARARAGAEGRTGVFLVAETDRHEWVGMVGGLDVGRRLELVSMWVAPTHRRRGLARSLIRALLDWASARGVPDVHLFVGDFNEPAKALYSSMGFVPSGRTKPLVWRASVREIEMVATLGPGRGKTS